MLSVACQVENGLMFLYQLVDIIETPLAAEELSAYKTLRTYSPTTTVINDAEAGMSVGYKSLLIKSQVFFEKNFKNLI